MDCCQNMKIRRKFHHVALSLLFLLISASSHFRFFIAQGRKLQEITETDTSKIVNEEHKTFLRAQIGSRPPRCNHRCQSCAHCEAIQVPTNPQTQNGKNSSSVKAIEYARSDANSNYKPMSWKCKCGNLIFNP